jgi:hypothetical protein
MVAERTVTTRELKALKSKADRLDAMKDETFYDLESNSYKTKADTEHYDLLEAEFQS